MASKPPRKPPLKPKGVAKPAKPGAEPAKNHKPKTFSVKAWSDEGEGEKIVLYGKSGIGKTTLAAMCPNAVFIGIDDGGRKIRNPLTGEPIEAVGGVQSYQDIRDALNQKNLFSDNATIVIDTFTKVEELAMSHIMETVTVNGRAVQSFRKYGWDGDRHLLDAYRLLLTDIDHHVHAGRNIVLLCQLAQITVANAEGADYLEDGPKLQHRKDCSIRTETIEWSDHVFRVGYLEFEVEKESVKDKAGKVTSGDQTRAVFAGGAAHFVAKARPVGGERIPPVISFESEDDDALWHYVFPKKG